MNKPVVLLSANYDASKENHPYVVPAYTDAVRRAGGIPVIVPFQDSDDDIERLLDCGDALIMTGGADVDPVHYGEPRHPNTKLKLERSQHFDLELARRARRRDMPVLGICLGIQQMNVVCGGTLYQDIEEDPTTRTTHTHKDKTKPRPLHQVRIETGTLLHSIVGQDEITANSSHHQSIRDAGKGLTVSAYCVDDDIIEGIEDGACRFFVGVQWHPETMAEPDTPHLKLFEALVRAAQTRLTTSRSDNE